MRDIDHKLTRSPRQVNQRRFLVAFLSLLGFGVVYDQLVANAHRRGYDDGYTALLVVAGVAATLLAAVPIIGRRHAERIFWLFVASGTPMVVGDIGRYVQRRNQHLEWVNGNGVRRNGIQGEGVAGGRRAFSNARPRCVRSGRGGVADRAG